MSEIPGIFPLVACFLLGAGLLGVFVFNNVAISFLIFSPPPPSVVGFTLMGRIGNATHFFNKKMLRVKGPS